MNLEQRHDRVTKKRMDRKVVGMGVGQIFANR
jgi:hypothetical protein